jgi:hypothetical protein
MLYCPVTIKERLEKAKENSTISESVNNIILKCIEYGLKELYEKESK